MSRKAKPPANALKAVAAPARTHESVHVSVRKISNGYLVSHAMDSPSGYRQTETFHKTKPKLNVGVAPSDAKRK